MLVPELFQHVHVRGIAGLGLFARRQRQLFKQDLTELLRGVDVEFPAREAVDLALAVGDPSAQHLVEAVQGVRVHQNAGDLHLRQNPAKGQIHFIEQLFAADLAQGSVQHRMQGEDCGGLGLQHRACGLICGHALRRKRFGLRELGVEIFHRELGKLVLAACRIQQIGRKLGVKDDPLAGKTPLQQTALELLRPVGQNGNASRKQGVQTGFPGVSQGLAAQDRHPAALVHGKGLQPLVGADGDGLPAQAVQPGGNGPGVRSGRGDGLRRRGRWRERKLLRLRGAETVLVDQLHKVQPQEEVVERAAVRLADAGVLRRKVPDRSVRADRRQLVGEVGAILSGLQLVVELALHILPAQMRIDPVQGPEAEQKVGGGLGADAGHAGDVVGGIAHQSLEVDQTDRLEAVFGFKDLGGVERGVGLSALRDHQLDRDARIHEL